MIKSSIVDGSGANSEAKVTSRGQLVVAPLAFSEPYAVTMDATNTAFVVAPPINGKQFVITDIIVDAGKNVSASTAGTIVLYEANDATTTTPYKTVLSIEMLKNTARTLTGLNLIVNKGKWVSIKTTDATVTATILGYYVTA
jgi:hypothetical protein